jgi:DNA-binding transcriptional MerR regulator
LDKSSDAFRTIGEMAKELGVKTHILRYWEEQFSMLRPLKRAGGRRHYRTEDVALLHKIYQLLYNEGYTIKGSARFLSGCGNPANTNIATNNITTANSVEVNTPVQQGQLHQNPQYDHTVLRGIRDRLSAALEAV